MPSQEFTQEVYGKAIEFRNKVQSMFKQSDAGASGEVATSESDNSTTKSGVFENMSSGA